MCANFFNLVSRVVKLLAILKFFRRQKLQNTSGPHVAAWGQCYKTFCGRKLRLFILSQSDCPWQAFEAQSYVCWICWSLFELSTFRCSTLGQAPGLTHIHQTRLERWSGFSSKPVFIEWLVHRMHNLIQFSKL